VTDHRFLGGPGRYRDSGMMGTESNKHPRAFWGADLDEAAQHLVDVFREVRPQVLVTYDTNGSYGHPDHIQSHRVAMRAVELAGADAPSKVYWTAIPRSVMQQGLETFAQTENNPFEGVTSVEEIPMACRRADRGPHRRPRVRRGQDGRGRRPRHPDPEQLLAAQPGPGRWPRLPRHRVLRAGRSASAARADRTGWRPICSPGSNSRDRKRLGIAARSRLGLVIRGLGLFVGIWGGVLLAAVGALYSPFRIGGVLLPLSVLIVVAGMILLIRFTYDATGHKWLSLVPGVVWLALTVMVSSRRTEGDLLLAQANWVATAYLFAGSITLGVMGYRLFLPPASPEAAGADVGPVATARTAARSAGSRSARSHCCRVSSSWRSSSALASGWVLAARSIRSDRTIAMATWGAGPRTGAVGERVRRRTRHGRGPTA
jgi:hypothetical protein